MNSSGVAKCDLPGFMGLLLWFLSISLASSAIFCMITASMLPVSWNPYSLGYTVLMIGLFIFCTSNMASFMSQSVVRSVSFAIKGMRFETWSRSVVPVFAQQLIDFKYYHIKNYYFFRLVLKKGSRRKGKRSYVFVCNLAHVSDDDKTLFLSGLEHMERLWTHQKYIVSTAQ